MYKCNALLLNHLKSNTKNNNKKDIILKVLKHSHNNNSIEDIISHNHNINQEIIDQPESWLTQIQAH